QHQKPFATDSSRCESPPLQLHRGTWQGCPLSPLVFALVLEPLAIAIRQNKNIVGIKAGGKKHKSLLCPSTAIPHILTLVDSFSCVVGPPSVRQGWQFSWQPSGLTYLGIKITPRLDNIMTINLLPLIQKIEVMLQNWTKLGLSLLGKINIVKMAIVPKINYISNMLPLTVYNFLWVCIKPCINRTKLYAAIEDGGLGLPHTAWYHYAFCLKQLSKLYMTADQAPCICNHKSIYLAFAYNELGTW
uniref:Reverse transcriptase domain-containing protein n=1 Tax=Mola mola TaxID=94237 RepID=A0A3Q4BAQ1_MOLML